MEQISSHKWLQLLYEAASSVLDGGASPSLLRKPLEELKLAARFRESEDGQRALQEAQRLHDSNEVDIDRSTMVYANGDDGYWVMGWCFVPSLDKEFEGIGLENDAAAIQ